MRQVEVTVTEFRCEFCEFKSCCESDVQIHETQHRGDCEHKEKTYRYTYDPIDHDISGINETCNLCEKVEHVNFNSWDQELAKKIWDLLRGKS